MHACMHARTCHHMNTYWADPDHVYLLLSADAGPSQENSMSLFSGPNFSLQTSPDRGTPAKVTAWGSPQHVSATADHFGFDTSLAAPPTPRGWFSAPTKCPPTNRPWEQSPLEQTEGPSANFLFHHTTAVGGAPAALRRPISTVFQSQGFLANGNSAPAAAADTASSPGAGVAALSFSAPSFTPLSGRRPSIGGAVMAPLYDYELEMEVPSWNYCLSFLHMTVLGQATAGMTASHSTGALAAPSFRGMQDYSPHQKPNLCSFPC